MSARTGVVVNNYDPTYQNRIQVRVYGVHDEQINGQYLILDDDLPWASPAPNAGGTGGSYSIPKVGSTVSVEGSNYKLIYHGQVNVKGNVKKIMHDNAEESENIKIISWSEDNEGGQKDFIKMYYLPEKGLNIECNGNVITLSKYDSLLISSKYGSSIEMTRDGDINITAPQKINISCKELNLTQGSLSPATADKLVLGSKLQEKFNNHKHFYSPIGGVVTDTPIEKLTEIDFSENIKISKRQDNR